MYQYSTGMPPVDISPCSVGQQLARSEDEMCITQIPGIDCIGPNILRGFIPGQLNILAYYQDI